MEWNGKGVIGDNEITRISFASDYYSYNRFNVTQNSTPWRPDIVIHSHINLNLSHPPFLPPLSDCPVLIPLRRHSNILSLIRITPPPTYNNAAYHPHTKCCAFIVPSHHHHDHSLGAATPSSSAPPGQGVSSR